MSKLGHRVYSIQQVNPLGMTRDAGVLETLEKYRNVNAINGDGIYGWPENKKFDSILVKQAVYEAPKNLINQLKPYGRLVVPIENEAGEQRVHVFLKFPDGTVESRKTLYVKMTHLLPGQDI